MRSESKRAKTSVFVTSIFVSALMLGSGCATTSAVPVAGDFCDEYTVIRDADSLHVPLHNGTYVCKCLGPTHELWAVVGCGQNA